MTRKHFTIVLLFVCGAVPALGERITKPSALPTAAAQWKIIGWNNLGMHCMDADFSVFAILPPFNEIHAQLLDPNGELISVPPANTNVVYQAVDDANGSLNSTSVGKSNFWQYSLPMLGKQVPDDMGVAGYGMPGKANTPQWMGFDTSYLWFLGQGVPITPKDDNMNTNYYPMMRIAFYDASLMVQAQTNIVLPVSDEMNCSACHASGSQQAAMPAGGWVWNPNAQQDYRQNILKLHDGLQTAANATQYGQFLAAAGYQTSGLLATSSGGKPILCDNCHLSNAVAGLGIVGLQGVPQLTVSVHSKHASVMDPATGLTLDNQSNRNSCYNCHPGSTTRCLRGAMGSAVASDGTVAIQCQSCHGNMSAVGASNRQGWLAEPNCQSCHTGTATQNSGQIRYTTVFDTSGNVRVPANNTFATTPDQPASGYSLYRFSTGHGGLQCEACHGSTHAEYPSTEPNDNVQSLNFQGHVGMLIDCANCHGGVQPDTANGGPHGMHPVGQAWVTLHPDYAEQSGPAQCQDCHGTQYLGTVLSWSQGYRVLSTPYGSKNFWRGFQISCYACHNGPTNENASSNKAPVVQNGSMSVTGGQHGSVSLVGSDANRNKLSYRVVSQPHYGTVGVSGNTATYYSNGGFSGVDTFTFAAWDGYTNSNLGTVTVTVQ